MKITIFIFMYFFMGNGNLSHWIGLSFLSKLYCKILEVVRGLVPAKAIRLSSNSVVAFVEKRFYHLLKSHWHAYFFNKLVWVVFVTLLNQTLRLLSG